MATNNKMIIPEGMKKCVTCNGKGRRYKVPVNFDTGIICKCEDCRGAGYIRKK